LTDLTIADFDRIKRLGSFATGLLADENFLDVMKGLKEDAIFGWTHAKSPDQREAFWRDMQAVGHLKAKLEELGQKYRVEVDKMKAAERKRHRLEAQREAAERG
jgi:hypothetical protein